MACGCKGHGPDPNCECKDLPKRSCGCPEGDICCMDCDCDCHEPAEYARTLSRAKEYGGAKLMKRVNAALGRLGDASIRDKQKLISLVWEQFNQEEDAKLPEHTEKQAKYRLEDARVPYMRDSVWRILCKETPDLAGKFPNHHVFMAYIEGFK